MRGFASLRSSYVRPSFSGWSPRRLSSTASAVAASAWKAALPSACLRSSVTLRLLRLKVWKKWLSPGPKKCGPTCRPTSPPSRRFSILITSAPRSARYTVPAGPAPYCSTARTRVPASGSRSLCTQRLLQLARRNLVQAQHRIAHLPRARLAHREHGVLHELRLHLGVGER